MAETLGSLCDKLTIVQLKQWHTIDARKLESLARQLAALEAEIDAFISQAVTGKIPPSQLKFDANKVYPEKKHVLDEIAGSFGTMVSKLAEANCALWHQQEKVYEFERIPAAEKNSTIKRLAVLNLERNRCIDMIDELFREKIVAMSAKAVPRPKRGPAAATPRRRRSSPAR